ncbi:MAG: NPCBM/NEW2 domain-containing protein [Phycisphaerae bacterium]|nr:NPCBM/NEW2 domain-containing protein [Phycisphaerae bacterium]
MAMRAYAMMRGYAARTFLAVGVMVLLGGAEPQRVWADAMTEIETNRQWAERAFSGGDREAPSMDRLSVLREDGPGDTKVGRCAAGGPLRLGGKVYERGIGINSHSVIRVSLARRARRLMADIGLDRNVDGTKASVRMRVQVEGKDVFVTEVIKATGQVLTIDVPLAGARCFDLVVDDGGDGRGWDQADWCDARVELENGQTVWLDELARQRIIATDLPFSFVYGGKPSTGLVGQWKRDLRVEEVEAGRSRRTLVLSDPTTGLEVRAVCTVYTDTPGIDWTLYFTNRGKQDTPILEQVKAVDLGISPGLEAQPILHRLHGSSCRADDWQPFDEALSPGRRIDMAPELGRPSLGACPFFNVSWKDQGIITAIGWSGQWSASVQYEGGALRIRAGMQHMHLKLRPGETIRSPRVLVIHWQGADPFDGYNLFRRTMLRHVMPKVDGKPVTPPIAHLSTSFYELDRGTEADVLAHLNSVKGLGFEFFWLDAYYGRNDFPTIGSYVFPIERCVNLKRFPRAIRPISDAAHAAGMKFLLWTEPERITHGTLMAKEHPEWLIDVGEDPIGRLCLFNLGSPDARDHITRFMNTIIKEWRIDCLRIDYASSALPCWEKVNKAEPDRAGIAEIRCVEGLYKMWDDILGAYPHLFIDNCASGGMRIDLETCSRSIPLWRTDATIDPLMKRDFHEAAIRNQVITGGLSRYLPFHTSGMMGAAPYHFRSGFNGGISFCEDCRPADYPKEMLKRGIAEGKRIRKYYLGNFYPLSEVTTSPREWCVMQYHRPDQGDGMVIAFRRHASPYAAYDCRLREIEPDAAYEVTYAPGYDRSDPVRMNGRELQRVRAEVAECPGSVIIEYRKVSAMSAK